MDIYRGNDTLTLVHPEDRSKGFLGMIQGSVTIVQNTDTVPQLGIILGREIFRKVKGGKDRSSWFTPLETEANRGPVGKRSKPFADHHA